MAYYNCIFQIFIVLSLVFLLLLLLFKTSLVKPSFSPASVIMTHCLRKSICDSPLNAETFEGRCLVIFAILTLNRKIKFQESYWNWLNYGNLFCKIQFFPFFMCVLLLRPRSCIIKIKRGRSKHGFVTELYKHAFIYTTLWLSLDVF